ALARGWSVTEVIPTRRDNDTQTLEITITPFASLNNTQRLEANTNNILSQLSVLCYLFSVRLTELIEPTFSS
ncbi:hypothetical protein KAU33_06425, partial [Candidatus Dependentiae bacterium]|nr:hypothetical protein [Candidatus Dependentiae bacterium]